MLKSIEDKFKALLTLREQGGLEGLSAHDRNWMDGCEEILELDKRIDDEYVEMIERLYNKYFEREA